MEVRRARYKDITDVVHYQATGSDILMRLLNVRWPMIGVLYPCQRGYLTGFSRCYLFKVFGLCKKSIMTYKENYVNAT